MSRGNQCCTVLLTGALCVVGVPAMATNILSNGNFDAPQGAPWVEINNDPQYPLIVTSAESPVAAHSGNKLVWQGGLLNSTRTLYQDVAVPVGQGKLKLTGYIQVRSEEIDTSVYDVLHVELRSLASTLLESLGQRSNLDANTTWIPFSFEAGGDYSGQTVRLELRATNDDSYVTSFFLDTFVLDARSTVDVKDAVPAMSQLSSAAPNPTRGYARLRLDLAGTSRVRASIYDLSGRVVRTIVEDELGRGSHELIWDGTDATGSRVPPGMYLSRVNVDGRSFSRPIVLIR